MKVLKAIDLFAGIGGIRLGLQKAGFKVVYSNDIDKYCKQTFELNFNDILDNRDITSIPSEEIPDHDLLAGGFPCQPFSMAGHQRGFDDPRGSLFLEVVRILRDKRPKAFLLENVKNLRGHNKGETLKRILYSLEEELGYTVYYEVLNSKDFGLAQNRERIYIVGFKDKIDFEFPKPLKQSIAKVADVLENNVEDSYFLSEKYYEGLVKHRERHQAKGNGFGFEILDPEGISYALVVGNMGRERNLILDKPRKGFYKVGMDKAIAKNSRGVRKLTIKECTRLQGFPEDFIFSVSNAQAYKQLGNTVSVPVVKEVAIKILDTLRRQSQKRIINNAVLIDQSSSSLEVSSVF